jgi:hypothetical protein
MKPRYTSRWMLAMVGVIGMAVVIIGVIIRPHAPTHVPEELARQSLFREMANEAGITWRMNFLPNEQGTTFKINLYDHGSGVAIGDFDGDGRDDIYFCNQLGSNALYRNKGDGTFEDVAKVAGVALGDRISVAATFVDYDNDGWADLYVTSTRGGNVLFHNEGNGTFKDVTERAGLTHVGHSQAALFFDADNDGHLDLLLTNTANWTSNRFDKKSNYWVGEGDFEGVVLSPKETNVFYHNCGDGTFINRTAESGLGGRGWAGDAVAFDYNGDGRMDVFVSCMFGRAQLYRNDGGGKFTDVTLDVLGKTSWGGLGARVFDFNNDGRLDLFLVDMHSDMWTGLDWAGQTYDMAVRSAKKKFAYRNGPLSDLDPSLIESERDLGKKIGFSHDEVIFGNTLYRNEGGGRFREVSDKAGLETFWPWGIANGDFDNDGYEDVFISAGMGYPFYYWPNSLMMNNGDGTFTDRAEEAGVEPPLRGKTFSELIAGRPATRSSRSAAVADFNGDGRLDIVVNNFNDQPYFLRNQFPRRNWVEFRLQGTRSNRDAIGAVVRLYANGNVMTRQVQAAGGYLSQSSRTVHFGLGDRESVERVEITWPSGTRQALKEITINTQKKVLEVDKP